MRYNNANPSDSEDRVNRFLAAHPAPAEALAEVLEGRTPPLPAVPPRAVEEWRAFGSALMSAAPGDDDYRRVSQAAFAAVDAEVRIELAERAIAQNEHALYRKEAEAATSRLREQRDALADALEGMLRETGAMDAHPPLGRARAIGQEALRKAGR